MAASRFYTYPAVFEPGDDGGFVVTFPDVEEAITQGVDRVDAMAQAVDALGTALLFYAKEGRSVPALAHPTISPP
jgi:antitoxin HicB